MRIEKRNLLTNENVTLTAYLLDQSPEMSSINMRPAVLIFPGGSYRFTSDREAEPVAMAYLSEGFHAFILRYSVREHAVFPAPLNDAEEALSQIHANYREWRVDIGKIAAVGFSAGGHLAAALGTMGKIRPNALVLGYPCILSSAGSVLAVPVPSVDDAVDSRTPPTFLFATFEDPVVPVENTIRFMSALDKHHIPFESHIFQHGPHGLSLAKSLCASGRKAFVNPDFAQWFGLSVSWLRHLFGDFPSR